MDEIKRQRLEASGWRVGTVEEFLELSPVESEIVELKLALSQSLKNFRKNHRLSQKAQKKEPTDLLGYKSTNSSCSLMAVACGFQCKFFLEDLHSPSTLKHLRANC